MSMELIRDKKTFMKPVLSILFRTHWTGTMGQYLLMGKQGQAKLSQWLAITKTQKLKELFPEHLIM